MDKGVGMEKSIIIIGGGSGGYVSAIRLSRLGNKVVLIEKDRIGGTCLNYGCIPTKSLYRNAEVYSSLKDLESFGIGSEGDFTLDISKVQERKQGITDTLVGGIEQLLKANNVKVIKGEARILAGSRVSVDGEEMSYDRLIIATGSSSFVPPIKGADREGVITSTEMLEFSEVPENLVIIGGGVIGMEFAGIMNAFGSKVTVVEALPSILPGIDSEMVKRMNPMLKKKGIEVFTSAMVSEIIEEDGVLKVLATTKKGEMSFIGSKVLIATGRKPNTGGFGLEEIGIDFDRKGIRVNEHFETNIPGIYAVGDVNGKLLLAHAAAAQAEYVAEHISGHEARIGRNIPACVFMYPELAMVGMTEDTLKENGIAYTSSKFLFGANGKALTMGHGEGLVKVLCDENEKVVGVHILGAHASDLIHEAVVIVEKGLTVEEIRPMVHAHPTLSEGFYEAVLGLKGEAVHLVPPRR